MAVHASGTKTEQLMAKRDAFVARGVALAPIVADHGHGARLTDVDGKEYIDFAGGIGVLNLGHTPDAVVDAIKHQAEKMLHSCFPVAAYEPYLEVAELLCENTPGTHAKKALLINSGAEAVENAVKIARYHTGRDGVITFDRGFHGRTLLTMSLTSKLVYKKGMGPFAPEIYRAPAPYPYRGVTTKDALKGLEFIFKAHVDPQSVACVVLEPVQGEGGFTVMPPEFIEGVMALCEQHGILYVDDEVQSGVGRTGPVWAIEHYGVEPDLLVSGKSLGGGLPLAGVTGKAEIMNAVPPGGLGGTFGGNPLACAAAIAVLNEVRRPEFRARAEDLGRRIRGRLDALGVGKVRGLGPMVAVELPEKSPERAARITAAARERGLVLLSCGMYGNVIRILVPLTIDDELLDRGFALLEEALGDADGD
jgi:4-aminobutyrate aminotransferase / (S)-3-amino-2-methylpropionate transaminase / 5-aminovalerate transaminase